MLVAIEVALLQRPDATLKGGRLHRKILGLEVGEQRRRDGVGVSRATSGNEVWGSEQRWIRGGR